MTTSTLEKIGKTAKEIEKSELKIGKLTELRISKNKK